MTQLGNSILNNALALKWKIISRIVGNSFTFGRNKGVFALSANKKSPNSPVGITTISFGGSTAAVIKQKIGFYYTTIVIGRSIASDWKL